MAASLSRSHSALGAYLRRMVLHFDALPTLTAFPDLTEREQEILRLLARG